MRNLLSIYSYVFIFLLTPSCLPKATHQEQSSGKKTTPSSQIPSQVQFLSLVDPSSIDVDLTSTKVESSEQYGQNFHIPIIRMVFHDVSFVQVLRCRSSFRSYVKANSEDKKQLWFDSFSMIDQCLLAGDKVSDWAFEDISVPKGDFFYLINPCLFSSFSTLGAESCRFDQIKISEDVHVVSDLPSLFLHMAQAYVDQKTQYEILTDQLRILTVDVLKQKQDCLDGTDVIAKNRSKESLYASLGVLGGAVATGGLLSQQGVRSRFFKGASRQKVFLGSGGFFALAGAIGVYFFQNHAPLSPACQALKDANQKLLDFQSSQVLQKAQQEMILQSQSMHKLYGPFVPHSDLGEDLGD